MKNNPIKSLLIISFLLVKPPSGFSQGTFVNLDFENPILPLIPGDDFKVPITNALPGWTGYIDSIQIGRVFYNTISLGAAAIALQGPGSLEPILQGQYTADLQPNTPAYTVFPVIAQTGLIPGTARSIRFYSDGRFSVSFAGQEIPIATIGNGPGYSVFGGDITSFANQFGELRFHGGGSLDNIWFSDQPIPEPSVLGLFAFGALLLGWRFLCKRQWPM